MLSERLRALLGNRNLSIGEFAESCDLPLETVRNIYYGRTADPKISTVMKMSKALNLSVNCLMGEFAPGKEEQALIHYYHQCGRHGKSIIELVAKYEATAAKAEREAADKHKVPCLVPHGNIYNGIVYENCEVMEVETAAKDAYVAIKMVTNDLLPAYCKGDVILFANRFPSVGEYAAFYIEDKTFIRKFLEEEGGYRLKCLHHMGEDIVLKRMDQVEYIGTCIGVIRE